MPLSTVEKSTLQASVQTLIDEVNALVVDPDPNPLQVALDAANAALAVANADLTAANDTITALNSKIDAAKAAMAQADAADAAEDTARANALAALN